MIVVVNVKDEGPLDKNFKAGDIKSAYADASPPGNVEKKVNLAIQFDDPPFANQAEIREELVSQEYAPGPTPDANTIRRERKHSVPFFRAKFSEAELLVIDDPAATLPDGPTEFGGTVLAGIVSGLFTFTDIVRK